MSCVLYSKGAYLKLERESRLANDLCATFAGQPPAEFLFELNADAYATRYSHHGEDNTAEIKQAREDTDSDYEFELTDWNDPTELHSLLKRIEYQCADVHDTSSPDPAMVARFTLLVAMREDCERRMVHPIYVAERRRKQVAAQAEAAIVKANDKERIITELRAKYPWAKEPNCSKNLKKELTLAFPGVKFSVRAPHHGSVTVHWVDGPTTKAVDEIASKYESGSFDGMTDSYDYDHSAYGEAISAVLGRSQYVSTSRSFTSRFLKDVALEVCFEYRHDDLPVVKESSSGHAWIEGGHVPYCNGARESLQDKILQTAYATAG